FSNGDSPSAPMPLTVTQCEVDRCSGVQGTALDVRNGAPVADAFAVEFGFVAQTGQEAGKFTPTSKAARQVTPPEHGVFSLDSNESAYRDNASATVCRTYHVTRGSTSSLSCQVALDDKPTTLPIHDGRALALSD